MNKNMEIIMKHKHLLAVIEEADVVFINEEIIKDRSGKGDNLENAKLNSLNNIIVDIIKDGDCITKVDIYRSVYVDITRFYNLINLEDELVDKVEFILINKHNDIIHLTPLVYMCNTVLFNKVVIKDRYKETPHLYEGTELKGNYMLIRNKDIDNEYIMKYSYRINITNRSSIILHLNKEIFDRIANSYLDYISDYDIKIIVDEEEMQISHIK